MIDSETVLISPRMPLFAVSESQKELIAFSRGRVRETVSGTIVCPFCEQRIPENALPAHIVENHSCR